MAKTVSKGRKTWKDGSVMTYTVTDDGVLTISGSLRDGCLVPFKSKAPFRHVVIADGIGYVGKENFKGLEPLEEVTLPSSVKEIRREAFAYCGNLKRINIPEGLATVGEYVFRGCVSLSGLHLPKTLSQIKHGAFMSCDALEKIRIPRGAELGDDVFCGCDSLRDVVLPKGLEVIPEAAFQVCKSLESITIPESVFRIERLAFSGCDKLQNIKLPEREDIKIAENAFGKEVKCEVKDEGGASYIGTVYNNKTDRGWASIRPADKTDMEGDVIVPSYVEYEGKNYPVTVIERHSFASKRMKTVTLPDTVVRIEESAFENCQWLREVYLGKSLQRIGDSAFRGCKWLIYMPLPETVIQVGYQALKDTRMLEYKNGVVYLDHVLYGYKGYLPEHSYIEVREGTTVIADSAFNSRLEYGKDYSNLEGVVLPKGMKRIGENAFSTCKNLSYVVLPKSIEYIGRYSFEKDIKTVSVPRRKPQKTREVEDCPKGANIIEETDRYTLDVNCVLTFKEDVTLIKDEEFKGRDDIKKVILPATVDSVGEYSFARCTSLREVVFSEGVRWIWRSAFASCDKLKKVQLPSTIEHICSSAFTCCKGLKEAVVHSSTWIENYAFSGCDALEKVIIRDIKPATTEN